MQISPKATYSKAYLYRRIINAKIFIDDHSSEKINLNLIAGEASFSKFHFIRLFYSVYHKTPYQYLSYIRIEKAKQLLTTNLAVAEVCFAVGFESVSSFTGLFKRKIQQTPFNYQVQQQKKIADMARTPLKFIPHCFAEKRI